LDHLTVLGSGVLETRIDATPTRDIDATPTRDVVAGAWGRAWRAGTIYWLIGHVFLAAVELVTLRIYGLKVPTGTPLWKLLVSHWVRWDGRSYVAIARFGYPAMDPTFHAPGSGSMVWPPGYPLLVRAASYVLPGDMNLAAVVVTNVAALGMLVVLYRLIEHESADPETATRTLLCLLAFPTAFFLAVGYSESVFLALTFAALYAARRGHWWYAGLAAGAASGVRVLGVTIVVAFAYEYLRQKGFRWRQIRPDALAIALTPAGLLAYMGYLWHRYDDPLLFRHAQTVWGRGPLAMPWTTLRNELTGWSFATSPERTFTNIVDLGALALALTTLVLCFAGPWRLRPDQLYLVLAGAFPLMAIILQPVAGPAWVSMARYVLGFSPMYYILGKMTANRHGERLLVFLGLPLQTGLLVMYLQNHWAG
jgi:hypothetical protein